MSPRKVAALKTIEGRVETVARAEVETKPAAGEAPMREATAVKANARRAILLFVFSDTRSRAREGLSEILMARKHSRFSPKIAASACTCMPQRSRARRPGVKQISAKFCGNPAALQLRRSPSHSEFYRGGSRIADCSAPRSASRPLSITPHSPSQSCFL